MTDPAAPYTLPGLENPKYKLSISLPMANSIAVINAPTHTLLQLICASGKYLNIKAKRTVTTANETNIPPMKKK